MFRFDTFSTKNTISNKKKCCIDFYEKHLNLNDLNYRKRLQKHRQRDFERRVLFILDTSTTQHDHL
jgi:hypothetical protein